MGDTGKIGRHLNNLRLEARIEHLLQSFVVPPGLGYVMVGEDLSVIGCQESCAKNIEVYLWSVFCKAHQGVVGPVGHRLTGWGERRVMQFLAGLVIVECQHNMDKTDARFISVDNRLCEVPLALELPQTAFYCRYLVLESGSFLRWTACRSERLVSQALARALQQALLREHAG